MATTSKAQFLAEVQTLLRERYPLEPGAEKLAVLEAVVYALCREDATREAATQALARLKAHFFDWNEARVSSLEEIQAVLGDLDRPEARALAVRRFLRQLFEKTYGFNLDALLKKPQKEALKALEDYEAFGSDYVAATTTRLSLAGHAIPVDRPILRALTRLGAVDGESDPAALRGALERAVPKNRGAEFADLVEALAHDTCVAGEPDCPRCVLQAICPTGRSYKAPVAGSGGGKAAPKPKAGRSKGADGDK